MFAVIIENLKEDISHSDQFSLGANWVLLYMSFYQSLFPKYLSLLTSVALSLGKVDTSQRKYERVQNSRPSGRVGWRPLRWVGHHSCSYYTIYHWSCGKVFCGLLGDFLQSPWQAWLSGIIPSSGHLCRCQDRGSPGNNENSPHTINEAPSMYLNPDLEGWPKCNKWKCTSLISLCYVNSVEPDSAHLG